MNADTVILGGSVVAAMVAGSIALFAPCCISVMLPAYLAGSVQNRRALVASTSLFGLGIATIVLPIAVGAQALRILLVAQHTAIYLLVGAGLLAMGVFALMGGRMRLPAPGGRPASRAGPFGVYVLGVFSGIASSCCAPVLVGVVALAGLASSFATAAGLGLAYVFGMVAPLFAIAVLWERWDWRSSRLFKPRSFTWRIGPITRTITGTDLATGILLVLMSAGTMWVALTGRIMSSPAGWQSTLTSWLQRIGAVVTHALAWVPPWVMWAALFVALVLLARRTVLQLRSGAASNPESGAEIGGGEERSCHEAPAIREREACHEPPASCCDEAVPTGASSPTKEEIR